MEKNCRTNKSMFEAAHAKKLMNYDNNELSSASIFYQPYSKNYYYDLYIYLLSWFVSNFKCLSCKL